MGMCLLSNFDSCQNLCKKKKLKADKVLAREMATARPPHVLITLNAFAYQAPLVQNTDAQFFHLEPEPARDRF